MAPARCSAPRPIKVFPFQIARRSSGYPSGIPNRSGKRRQCLSSSEHNADNRRASQLASGAGSLEPPVLPRVESIAPGGSWRQTGRKWRPQRSAPKLGPFSFRSRRVADQADPLPAVGTNQIGRPAQAVGGVVMVSGQGRQARRSIDWNRRAPYPHHQTRSLPVHGTQWSGLDHPIK